MLKGIDATVFFRRGNHNPIFVKKITNENDKSRCIDDEQSQIRNENEHPPPRAGVYPHFITLTLLEGWFRGR